jgi:hypothetical protein
VSLEDGSRLWRDRHDPYSDARYGIQRKEPTEAPEQEPKVTPQTVAAIDPVEQVSTGPIDLGQGKRGYRGNVGSLEAGKDLWEDRHGKRD